MRFDLNKSYYTFIAEANKKYVFDLLGAEGAGGGSGGHTQAIYQNTTNTTLYLYVGGGVDRNNPRLGGYNGGGNGGTGYVNTSEGYDYHGFGGGGASDVRTGTVLSTRILVAGGGGGAGGSHTGWGRGGKYPDNNEDGYPTPPQTEDGYILCAGGSRGTLTAGGAGGVAPSLAGNVSEGNNGTYYYSSGGGGGGGYYGGGGGSTGVINGRVGTTYTGSAGTAGSLGQGGTGGGKTSGASAWTWVNDGGTGGGGSSYIAPIAQISHPSYDQMYNHSGNNNGSSDGYILVHEVISAPKITNMWKDGDTIYATISKEELEGNENIEEIFYYNFSLDNEMAKFKKAPISSVTVSNSNQEVTIQYTIDSKKIKSGLHKLYLGVSSADDKTDEYNIDFMWNNVEPNIEFNPNISNKTLIQGSRVNDFFTGTGLFLDGESLIYEYKLIIDGKEFKDVYKSTSTSIYLPFIYNGVHNSEYKLKVKVRVGQMAFGHNGIGKELWSKWFESEELTIFAPIIPLNKLKFNNKLSDKAIEKDTKLKLSWGIDENLVTSKSDNNEYILYLFKDDELLYEENCGKNTEKEMIMSFPQGEGYKFGVSILNNGMFLSDMNFGDVFQIADISTGDKVVLSENLNLITSITDTFDRIEVLINNGTDLISIENINITIPNWKLKNGHNLIEVKIYLDDVIYVKHTFKVYIHILKENISNIDTHTLDVSVSINNESNFTEVLLTKDSYVVDLGASEKEFETSIDDNLVEEITQKITVKKIDNEINHDLKIIEIVGGLG